MRDKDDRISEEDENKVYITLNSEAEYETFGNFRILTFEFGKNVVSPFKNEITTIKMRFKNIINPEYVN